MFIGLLSKMQKENEIVELVFLGKEMCQKK